MWRRVLTREQAWLTVRREWDQEPRVHIWRWDGVGHRDLWLGSCVRPAHFVKGGVC